MGVGRVRERRADWGRVLACAACALWLGAAAPRTAPVPLAPQPGGTLDSSARILARDDLAKAQAAGEVPLVLVGSAKLSAADRPALFVQLQSPYLCGSAGCSTSVFLWRGGAWSRVLDGVAGKLEVSSARTHGFSDIVAESTRYRWDGKAYRDAQPAPAINLKPR